MLKLKGQTESGEWMEFNISQVFDVYLRDNRWYVKGYPNDYIIDSSTIQPADDPRKQMLDEIRRKVKMCWRYLTNWRPSCEVRL